HEIDVAVEGGPGRRLVLVHGFTQGPRSWDTLVAALEPPCEIVRVTLPGHGRPAPVRGRGGSGGRRGGGGRRPGAGHLARLLPRRTPGPAGGARPARPRRGAGVAGRHGRDRGPRRP